MSDPTQTPLARPMTADDYAAGTPVRQARGPVDHPTRDLVMGAVVGALALWAVPKLMDAVVNSGLLGGRDDDEDLELYE